MPKKKQYKVIHWLDMGIFNGSVMFSCGFSYDEITKLLKAKKATEWLLGLEAERELVETSEWLAMKREIVDEKTKKPVKLLYIIVKDTFKFTDQAYCALAHEVLHVCQYYLVDVLDRLREHEAEAYLHTYLMRQCLEAVRGPKK